MSILSYEALAFWDTVTAVDDVNKFYEQLEGKDSFAYPSVAVPEAARRNAWDAYRAIIG